MRRRIEIAAVTAALCGCASFPRPASPARVVDIDERILRTQMPFGLTLVTAAEPESNLAYVLVRFDVGAKDDPPDKAGLAHLVEHLSFELGDDSMTIEQRYRAIALDHNAATSWEYTEYTALVVADDIDKLLAAEALRLRVNCSESLSDDVFEREREVVRNERRTRKRSPMGAISDVLRTAAYGRSHPYARPIGGDEEQLDNITRGDVCAFMDRHYGVNRATVVIVGGKDRTKTAHAAATAFARSRRVAITPQATIRHPRRGRQRTDVDAPVDQPAVYVAWRAPPLYSRPGLAAILALQLAKEDLQQQTNMPVDVFVQGGQRAPLLGLWVGVEHVSEIRRALDDVWESVDRASGPTTPDEFRAVLLTEMRDRMLAFESLAARATLYADYNQFQTKPVFFGGDLAALEHLTPVDTQTAARALFRRDGATTVIVRPANAGKMYERGAIDFDGAVAEDNRWRNYVDPSAAARPMPLSTPATPLDGAQRIALPSGLTVVLLRRGTAPIVTLRLVFAAGRADEPVDRPGLARYAAGLLVLPPGAPRHPPTRKDVQESGGQFSWRVTEDATEFQVRGLSAYADVFAGYLGALFSHGEYPPAYVAAVAEQRRRELSREDVEHRSDFLTAFGRAVYGEGHPYAFVSELDGIRRGIDPRRLDRFRRNHYGANNATLFVTGNFDPATTIAHIRYWFTNARQVNRDSQRSGVRAIDRNLTIELERPGPVVDVAVAYPVNPPSPREHAALLLLRALLERRALIVRTELGAAYSAFAAYDELLRAGALWAQVTADAQRADAATAALRAQIAAVRRLGDDLAADFVAARRDVVRKLLADSSDSLADADSLQYLEMRRLSGRYFADLARHASALVLDDVRQIASATLSPTRERVILHGPRAATKLARKAVGF